MIDFQKLDLSQREEYNKILFSCPPRGCEYSFANQSLWGLQKVAFIHGCVAFFSHYFGRSVYPYPIGNGNRQAVIEDIPIAYDYAVEECELPGAPAGYKYIAPKYKVNNNE